MKRIKVLMADDNRVVRDEFRKILKLDDDLDVVGEAIDGLQAVVMVKRFLPAVVLMDVAMPLLNGLQATRKILKSFPATKVLMLSAYNDEAYIVEAINSGAKGYLIKQTCADYVCHAIREVQKGNTFFSPSIPRRFHKRKLGEAESMNSRATRLATRTTQERPEDTPKGIIAESAKIRATGNTPIKLPPARQKNPAAVALGMLGAGKGGRARAANLSKSKRTATAKNADAKR
jgi:DNA-binding NarL/FixJ family response regulator